MRDFYEHSLEESRPALMPGVDRNGVAQRRRRVFVESLGFNAGRRLKLR